jgi:TonB-dependent SusC/RagA subfamily outer membrane receptor
MGTLNTEAKMIARKTYAPLLAALTLFSGGCAVDDIVAAPEPAPLAASREAGEATAPTPRGISIPIRSRAGGYSVDRPPLFVLDGRALDTAPSITQIDPDQIESIEILKGELAVARHGPRAVHGVILITTKAAAANP